MRPEHGGRVELKLGPETATTARYVLSIFTPQGEATTEVSVDGVTSVLTIGQWQGSPPPAWLEALARSLLRTMVRSKQSDGDWPRRVTRWRPEPRQ